MIWMRQTRTSDVLRAFVKLLILWDIYSYAAVGTDLAGWFSGGPLFELIDKETGGDYKN